MAADRWQVGDVTITRVVESVGTWNGTILLPEATAENVRREGDWLFPRFADAAGQLKLSIHAFVVESQGRRIVVDTCVGNDKPRTFPPEWDRQHWPFLANLEAAGYRRDAIDVVLCTHLHVDHVGWNTMREGDRWVPTFPKARLLVGGTEWDFFSTTEDEFLKTPVEDSVRPVMAEGLAQLVDAGHRVTDEIWLAATPGHTPGHASVRISSRGEEAVITGDVLHHPILCGHPEWDNHFDYDCAAGKRTRREFCDRYADSPVLVLGTHFAAPAGRIVRHGDAYRFVTA